MHGFPDNLHIWDDLIPYLLESGRRVVTFDFLGFGASDKLAGAVYSFEQQLGDLEAVVESLGLGKIVPVAHDSSVIATINYALAHPQSVDSVVMLNSAYAEDATVLWPELVTLFATRSLQALAMGIAKPRTIWLAAQVAAAEVRCRASGGTDAPFQCVRRTADQR
jgi:haloalkane dehalogenase